MALRNLNTPTMVAISTAWLDPESKRPLLESFPLARALLPHLEKAHGNLVAYHRAISVTKAILVEMRDRLAALDAQHDRKIRGIFSILSGFAEVSDDDEQARRYLDLRRKLLPEGLRAVSRSYMEEAGEIILLRGRLDADAIALLRSLPSPQGSLYDEVEAWIRLGQQIGDLDYERALLAGTSSPGDVRQADVARARNEWIRVVHTLRTSLGFDNAPEEVIERIFRQLDHEEAKADRRQTTAKTQEPPPAAPSSCADEGETGNER